MYLSLIILIICDDVVVEVDFAINIIRFVHFFGRKIITIIISSGTRRNVNVLYKPSAKLEIRDHFFTVRVVRSWNALPEKVKEATSVNAFKTALDKWMQDKTIQPETRGRGTEEISGT